VALWRREKEEESERKTREQEKEKEEKEQEEKRKAERKRLEERAAAQNGELERGASQARLSGVLLLASCPDKDWRCNNHPVCRDWPSCQERGHTERNILDGLIRLLRDKHGQLVAAGYAGDLLNSSLGEEGRWKDAYMGKLDAIFQTAQQANLGLHIVTIRGSRMCNWERQVLQKTSSGMPQAKVVAHAHDVIKATTHFNSKEEFEKWLENVLEDKKRLVPVPDNTRQELLNLHNKHLTDEIRSLTDDLKETQRREERHQEACEKNAESMKAAIERSEVAEAKLADISTQQEVFKMRDEHMIVQIRSLTEDLNETRQREKRHRESLQNHAEAVKAATVRSEVAEAKLAAINALSR